jgi:hypothetical protein
MLLSSLSFFQIVRDLPVGLIAAAIADRIATAGALIFRVQFFCNYVIDIFFGLMDRFPDSIRFFFGNSSGERSVILFFCFQPCSWRTDCFFGWLQWDSFFSSKNAARLLQELLPG